MKFSLSLVTIVLLGMTSAADPVWAASDPKVATSQSSSISAKPASTDSTSTEAPEKADPSSSEQFSALSGSSSAVSTTTLLPAGDGLPDTTELVTRMGLSLLVVIFLIWGAVQLLRKFSPGGPISSGGTHIRVLDRAYIAPKKSIFIVQIGDKALALGISDQHMTTLTDLDLEDTLAQYADVSRSPVTRRFSDILKAVNARFTRQTEAAT